MNWIDHTLGVRRKANTRSGITRTVFDFQIIDTVEELDRRMREKALGGDTARLTAGFCRPWNGPRPDGTLLQDVEGGSWTRAWNAKEDAGRLAAGVPNSVYWASDPAGIEQVGCVYTAQEFEFDYGGVIFGIDLRYDSKTATWIGDPTHSHDSVVRRSKAAFVDMVKTPTAFFSRAG